MKKIVLILLFLLISADICISSIPPSPYKATEKYQDNNPPILPRSEPKIKNIPTVHKESDSNLAKIKQAKEAEIDRWKELKNQPASPIIETPTQKQSSLTYLLIIALGCIVLFLIYKLSIGVFKTISKILYEITQFPIKIKLWLIDIYKTPTNNVREKKEKVIEKTHNNSTVDSGFDIKDLGFNFFKKTWVRGGVNKTLEQTGIDIQFARHITDSLDSIGTDIWNLILDCTKDLNNQCSNVFSSWIVLELYKLIFENNIETSNNMYQINDSVHQLQDSIEYQSNMGHELEIAEAKNRFEYITKKFYEKGDTPFGVSRG